MDKVITAYNKGYRITENGTILNPQGKEIKGCFHHNGRINIKFREGENMIEVLVHRLQAYQKYGYKMFKDGIVVRHFNGNCRDNSKNNILIGTASQNQMDIPEIIRVNRAEHASSFMKKYEYEEIINYHLSNGSSYKKTMNHFNISSKGTLNYILKK